MFFIIFNAKIELLGMKEAGYMTSKEKKKLRFEYWKLLVAQSANVDEFGEKNYNIDQRILAVQDVFWALDLGVPAYADMDDLIRNQTWRFNIDSDGARYYTYINKDGSIGDAISHVPEDLKEFVDKKNNWIR